MALNAYSRAREGSKALSANFIVGEFARHRRFWWTKTEM
jgi:hypothetical protein